MSLYHEAAEVLYKAKKSEGSLKSIVFGKKTWKTNAKTLFALTTEAAKWSEVLSEVIERSGILGVEKNLTPTLALLLTHDLFLAKKGVALPATHGLNTSISRHKVRLSAELTKARLRRGCSSLDALRSQINQESISGQTSDADSATRTRHPRWIRINTIKSSLDEELLSTFTNYTKVASLKEITHAPSNERLYYIDEHIPDLIAITGPDDPTTFKAYKQGKLIFQEKASCFPAYLLNPFINEGDVIDACAAPGNKTTHLASYLSGSDCHVIACEKDRERSRTLEKMVRLAGANETVKVKQKQDFLRLDPNAKEFRDVSGLLLDPSCSGSGIFGRDEGTTTVRLPAMASNTPAPKGKKRKRGGQQPAPEAQSAATDEAGEAITEETPDSQEEQDAAKLKTRLENLSGFQLRILKHAMSFPRAVRITYSTCSVHDEENENVVVRALQSDVAKKQGWRIMTRDEQVDGLKKWHMRGSEDAVRKATHQDGAAGLNVGEIADGCIRCEKGGDDGTMGFFVAGFRRDADASVSENVQNGARNGSNGHDVEEEEEEEWNGFSDDET